MVPTLGCSEPSKLVGVLPESGLHAQTTIYAIVGNDPCHPSRGTS